MSELSVLSLKAKNSFSVETRAKQILSPSTIEELHSLPDLIGQAFYVLGEGSNTLFTDDSAPLIICPNFKGVEIYESHKHFQIKVGAAENWHALVKLCISKKMFGLENLALIPGSAGAAPVQNIGAYGVEFSDFCWSVDWFDFETKTIKVLSRDDCKFGYRDSIFKQELNNLGLIISITLRLEKNWQANLSYQGLDSLSKNVSAEEIFLQIIKLRESKLPDPRVLPNAGSFFKNPLVDSNKLTELQNDHSSIPVYPQKGGMAKLAAGWLIEQCGLKGYRLNRTGVHAKQALVLVNYDHGSGQDIIELARYVQGCVEKKFAITLEPEVKMVTKNGEATFAELSD